MSETTKPPVQYVLVRKDLPVYIQMVNVGHACGEAIRQAPISRQTVLRLLHVENEQELAEYAQKLTDKGFYFALVNEPDAPYNGAAMALATEPSNERLNALSKMLWHLEKAQEDTITPSNTATCTYCKASLNSADVGVVVDGRIFYSVCFRFPEAKEGDKQ